MYKNDINTDVNHSIIGLKYVVETLIYDNPSVLFKKTKTRLIKNDCAQR